MLYHEKFVVKFSTFLLLLFARNLAEAAGNEYGFKIYNGTEVPRDNPYLKYVATINFIGTSTCGGVLIAPRAVLSAAHCVNTKDKVVTDRQLLRRTLVCAGSNEKDCGMDFKKFRIVIKIILHDEFIYDPDSEIQKIENDLAIFIPAIPYDRDGITVDFITLPSGPPRVGALCDFIGFGDTTCQLETYSLPETAQFTNLVIESRDYCLAIFPFSLASTIVCAGDPNNNTLSCKGDSGSGLFCDGTVVGVLSLSLRTLGVPSVFTGVYYYREWIEKVLHSIKQMKAINAKKPNKTKLEGGELRNLCIRLQCAEVIMILSLFYMLKSIKYLFLQLN